MRKKVFEAVWYGKVKTNLQINKIVKKTNQKTKKRYENKK